MILFLFLVIFAISNFLILYPTHLILLDCIFITMYLLILPGALTLMLLGSVIKSFWEKFCITVGISVGILMFYGLVLNFILPNFDIIPFSRISETVAFDYLLTLLFVANLYKYRSQIFNFKKWVELLMPGRKSLLNKCNKKIKKVNLLNTSFYLYVLTFPVLSTLGAISLNNGGSNFFSMFLLGDIGLLILLITLFRNKISEGVFLSTIYFIGLAILLMTSLRGWYMTGHDVQFEYYIFQLTKSHQYWNIDFYKDAYNACLSITILPTILANLLPVRDVYIFKVVFQIIFALCPVSIYLLIRKYSTSFIAFISAFYFITFPTYLNDMPMLNRQEIAFLFFSLLLLILFRNEKTYGKFVILGLLSFGLITSHYSTNYIALILLVATYITYQLIRFILKKKIPSRILHIKYNVRKLNILVRRNYIPLSLITFLCLITLVWNGLLTNTSNHLLDTLSQTFTNVENILKQENMRSILTFPVISSKKLSDSEYLSMFKEKQIDLAKRERVQDFYSSVATTDINQPTISVQFLPLTPIGKFITVQGVNVFNINYDSRQLLADLIQILVALGFIGFVVVKNGRKYDTEYIIACLICIVLLGLMVVLPVLPVNYSLLRLVQQLLIILGLPVTLGLFLLLAKFKKLSPYLVSIVSILFFLNLSGFVSEITGGYYPQLGLRNGGSYFDAYFTHDSEVASIKWLESNMIPNSTVQTDPLTRDKLLANGNIPTLSGIFPETYRQHAYVYSGYFNTTAGGMIISTDRSLVIAYPTDFLESNKDLVYNNGLTKIYK